MNRTRVPGHAVVFALVLAFTLIAAPLPAQWLNYPTAGVSRKADGSPNLDAPAPRTTYGKPDLSGIWEPVKNRPCTGPTGCPDGAPQEYFNIGWSLKGGLPYQPSAAALVKSRTEKDSDDDPATHCLPMGIVHTYTTPFLKKMIQTPGLLVLITERNASYRQIFTDGRPLPQDPQPSFNGYSTGKWDGDTLVVESNGFQDGIWLDHNGSPLTESAKLTERFRRLNFGRLEIEITVDDPTAYTKPWTVKLNQSLVPDTDLLDAYCLENEKDIQHFVTPKQAAAGNPGEK